MNPINGFPAKYYAKPLLYGAIRGASWNERAMSVRTDRFHKIQYYTGGTFTVGFRIVRSFE